MGHELSRDGRQEIAKSLRSIIEYLETLKRDLDSVTPNDYVNAQKVSYRLERARLDLKYLVDIAEYELNK